MMGLFGDSGAVRFSVRSFGCALFIFGERDMRESKPLTGYPSVDKPWLKYYSLEAINAPLPENTVYEYLWENNKDYPSDIAFNYLGRKISYKELFENIDKTAAAFLKAGVKEKEIVTVALPSIPEALYCVYALNKIGAVANMIHPLAGKDETLFYFNEVQSRIAVIFDGAYAAIADDIGRSSVKKVIVASPADSLPVALKIAYKLKVKAPQLDGKVFQRWKSFIWEGKGTPVKAVKKNCREMAIISHTGGTTGEPKGVMCSDFSLNALMYQIVCNFKHDRTGCSLVVLPPFVNYSLVEAALAMLAIGYTVALIPKYEPEKFTEYVKEYRPSVVLSIPAYWNALLNNQKQVDMSCFEHIYFGGEGMSEENENAVNEYIMRCGSSKKLCKGLGSTELMAAASQSFQECNPIGSVGIPLVRTNCRVEDPDTGEELRYQEEGELCFQGPTLMLGYYNAVKATEEIIKVHSDGQRWLHTGDLGYIDENGVIFVTGRIKRLIMTSDHNGQVTKMFPDRIEKVLTQHPAISVCCVIGVKDKTRIHHPKAFAVLNDGFAAGNALTKEIRAFCQNKLPGYMIPDEIEYRAELPRTSRGKIDYRTLEETENDQA